jgi:hypothetical protein
MKFEDRMQNEHEGGISPTIALSPLGHVAALAQSKYERLILRAKQVPAAATIVVHPCDETSLRGAVEAAQVGIIVPTLVGPARLPRSRASMGSISAAIRLLTLPTATKRRHGGWS